MKKLLILLMLWGCTKPVLYLPKYPDVAILWIRGARIVQPMKEYTYEFWFSGTADSLLVELWAIAPKFSGGRDELSWRGKQQVNTDGEPVVKWMAGSVVFLNEGYYCWKFKIWNKYDSDFEPYFVHCKRFNSEYEQPDMPWNNKW